MPSTFLHTIALPPLALTFAPSPFRLSTDESARGALYRRVPDAADQPSPHATAAVLAAGLAEGERARSALAWLEQEWRAGRLAPRVTPYFATHVAWAFARYDLELARAFALEVYGAEAARYGTISEKGPDDSRAHGWSIGFAGLLLSPPAFPRSC